MDDSVSREEYFRKCGPSIVALCSDRLMEFLHVESDQYLEKYLIQNNQDGYMQVLWEMEIARDELVRRNFIRIH